MFITLLCVAFAAYWTWKWKTAKTTEPPTFPGAWPIIGHVPLLIGNSTDLFDRLNRISQQMYEIGGVASFFFGPKTVYAVADPEDCVTVTQACLEKDSFYNWGKPWLGEGLVTAKYSTWKNHRKLLNPAFSQTLLDTFMGVFNSQSRKLVKDLEKEVGKGLFDHWTYIRLNALETICLTALGVDFTDVNLNSKYVEATELILNTIMERVLKPWLHSRRTFAWSNVKKTRDASLKILHKMSYTVLQKRKSDLKENKRAARSKLIGPKIKTFIDILIELSAETGAFSDRQIRAHVDTILVAGHDTTSNVLTFTMILLGSHPEAQEKVYAELQEVLGGDRDVEKTDLSKLVYLEAVLKESMRVFTIAPIIGRKLDKDVKLKNCTLSAGQTCIIFIFALHNHPTWGPDVHEFKPERWLEPGRLPDHPNAFSAFSVGPRQCIGKAYALMSMKTTLAHVVRNYRIKADHTKVRLKIDVMMKPDSGYYVSIERRKT